MLSNEQIQAAADRIVAALKPKKVILFGSYARYTLSCQRRLASMFSYIWMPARRFTPAQAGDGMTMMDCNSMTDWCKKQIDDQ